MRDQLPDWTTLKWRGTHPNPYLSISKASGLGELDLLMTSRECVAFLVHPGEYA